MEVQAQEILSILPTKSNIETMADAIAYDVEQGNIDGVEAAVKLSAIELLCKTARTKIENTVIDILNLYNGKKGFDGAKVEKAEVGTKYDYSQDSNWRELKATVDEYNDRLKDLEDKLKKIPAGKLLVDEETGETLIGPSKSSKTSFKITLSK